MKHTKVTLVPLTADDHEQFILDNQWSFKYGALEEFGERDDHIDDDGEIISRRTIEHCIDDPQSETSPERFSVRKSSFSINTFICVCTALFCWVLRACGSRLP